MMPENDQARDMGNVCKHLVKFGRVVFKLCDRTDRQTDKLTDILITISSSDVDSCCSHTQTPHTHVGWRFGVVV